MLWRSFRAQILICLLPDVARLATFFLRLRRKQWIGCSILRVSEVRKQSADAMAKQQPTKLMVIGSAVLAVAPKCPVCLGALFGIFGVATVSGSVYHVWLPTLTAIWLALTVGLLAFRSSGGGQRRYGPALLALFAGLAVFVGKFIFNEQALVYAGIAALLGAAVWRAWLRTSASSASCLQCERQPLLHDQESMRTRHTELPTYGNH